MDDRQYQTQCLGSIEANFENGVERQLAVLATGTGKTVIAGQIPRMFPGKRTMFLVHTEELATQAADKMSLMNPTLKVGIEMAGSYAGLDTDIVVASVQTLGRAGSNRLAMFRPEQFGAIIIDEAHHSTGETYERVIDHFGLLGLNPHVGRLLLGITATPGRSDGVGLSRIFDKVVFTYSLIQAIKDGWLVPPRGLRVRTKANLDAVHSVAGDFDLRELSLAVNTAERNDLLVNAWIEHGESRKTIGFTVDIQHAKDLAAAFAAKGVRSEAVWGVDKERHDKLQDLRNGHLDIVLNANVLTEGYDDPSISCILLAAPTKSQLRYTQRVGRGTRLPEGIKNLNDALFQGLVFSKRDLLVLDGTDATSKHSLATLPSIFGLPKDLSLEGQDIPQAVEILEQAAVDYPELNLDGLTDLHNLQTYIERMDLLNVRYAPEVEANSKYQWHRSASGDYVLLLPRREQVNITQDLIGKWKITGMVNGSAFEDYEPTLEQAFGTADNMLRYLGRNLMQYVRRENPSKKLLQPMTGRQKLVIETKLRNMGRQPIDLGGLNQFEAGEILRKLEAA